MTVVENYKGVDIACGIVCYDIRYFVMNKMFTQFPSIEEAREDIDRTIFIETAQEWIKLNKEYMKHINFTETELIQIGKNIKNVA